MKVLGFNWWAIPPIVVGIGGSLVVLREAVAGPPRVAHPSDSWGTELIVIAAEFEDLEFGSVIPAELIEFSPDGRLPHNASLIRVAAWAEGWASVEDTYTILTHMEGCTGKLAGFEFRGAVPTPTACSSNLAILEMQGASRRSSAPALHEAHKMLGAGAGTSASNAQASQFAQSRREPIYLLAFPSTLPRYLQRWQQSWTSPEAHNHWRKSSEWIWVGATTQTKCTEVLYGGRSGGGRPGRPRPDAPLPTQPSRISRSYHCIARDGGVRSSGSSSRGIRESGASRRGASSSPLWSSPKLAMGHRDGHRRPRRGQNRRIRMPARDTLSDLRDARVSSEGQLLGLSDPGARPDVLAVRQAIQVRQQGHGQQRRKGQRRRGKPRPDRDLHDGGPTRPRDRARQFPQYQSGWSLFFAPLSSFSRETEFTKFVSNEIATARSRHAPRRRRISMPASPRHRAARCNRHEAPVGIVALVSCCLVRLSNGGLGPPDDIVSLPACTRLNICCGAALASRLDPLAFTGDKRGRCKALFFALLNGPAISDLEPVRFLCDPENWADGRNLSESTAKDVISARISFPARAAIVPSLDWLPACVAHDFCNPENPTRSGTTLHSLP